MFQDTAYIKATNLPPRDSVSENTAPRFRKGFCLEEMPTEAKLHCAGLGFGYFYLNGKAVTEDLYTAPISDYHKTVWYCSYDVLDLLQQGENMLAAILGNGFFNETHYSLWRYHDAAWRDVPKLIAKLELTFADGRKQEISSDGSWRCTEASPYLFNALRSGETYDARLEEPGWNNIGFDDSAWQNAVVDTNAPKGVLRHCLCEPIREFETYQPARVIKHEDSYVFCFPQNISGYVRLRTGSLTAGQTVVLRYAEGLGEDNHITYYDIQDKIPRFYHDMRYAYAEFTANGEDFIWTPKFTYYGFRYVEVTGLTQEPPADFLEAVFVHQAIDRKAEFSCSDWRLTRLYQMGIYATWSNLFYQPTDCPSREKMGWGNDAQASAEQFLLNFQSVNLLKKWYQDVLDSIREDGAVPCVIPGSGFGYNHMTGPICSGVLFEIPWQLYWQMGDDSLLCGNTEAFKAHLRHIASNADQQGMLDYGLCDWAGPWEDNSRSPVPSKCTNTLLYIKFLRMTAFACERIGEDASQLRQEEKRITQRFIDVYFDPDGKMNLPYQCALGMCVALDVYPDLEVISRQLVESVEESNRHINCGMLGVQYLYKALEKIGRTDLAYAIVTAEGYPGYFSWIDERDATTLCEAWIPEGSQNHHMFSNLLVWMMRTLAGIRPAAPGYAQCVIQPYFPKNLDSCDAKAETPYGTVAVHWEKLGNTVRLEITVPEQMKAQAEVFKTIYPLAVGKNILEITQ